MSSASPAPRPLVAFDLDDTLYPEYAFAEGVLREGAEFLERQLGVSGIASTAVRFLHERSAETPPLQRAARVVAGVEAEPWLPSAVQVLKDSVPVLTPFPDTVEVLRSLARWCTLAIVTEGRDDTQRGKLSALGLTRFFSHVVIAQGSAGSPGKMTGAPYARLLELAHDPPDRFMIGDQFEKDVASAGRSGFVGILVRRPSVEYVHPDASGAKSYSDLSAALRVIEDTVRRRQKASLGTDTRVPD